MSVKFGPVCKLSVEGSNNTNVVIPPELTVEFEVNRSLISSSQTATFTVKNLAEKTRNLIYKDQYATGLFRAVQFSAGYENNFEPMIFNGFIRQAYSYREGVDFLTVIDAYDGALAMANGFTSRTVGAGASAASIITSLVSDLPNTNRTPILGNFSQTNPRGEVLFGNTWQLIVQKSGGVATIDNNQVKALGQNEVIAGEISVINADTGLLNSPRRYDALIEFDLLFEPRLTLGQRLVLESSTNSLFNGVYKVMGFVHSGVISPAQGGQRKTTVSLWLGTSVLQLVTGR